jgi:hypothetical protein
MLIYFSLQLAPTAECARNSNHRDFLLLFDLYHAVAIYHYWRKLGRAACYVLPTLILFLWPEGTRLSDIHRRLSGLYGDLKML